MVKVIKTIYRIQPEDDDYRLLPHGVKFMSIQNYQLIYRRWYSGLGLVEDMSGNKFD